MKNSQKASKVSPLKLLLTIPLALAFFLPINVQAMVTSTKIVTVAVKDSVTTEKNAVKTSEDNTIRKTRPAMDQADKNGIFMVVDKMPEYPGGINELLLYISHHVKYPVDAQEKRIQGKIIVRFVVTKSGKIDNAEVIRGLYPAIDKEGLRVINSLPDWIPGEQKGEKVPVWYTIPITFKLTGSSKSSLTDPKIAPVLIMDGKVLPIGYDISTMNKDSIQSVNILKADTEAKKAELILKYGNQAANGVIIITKKK